MFKKLVLSILFFTQFLAFVKPTSAAEPDRFTEENIESFVEKHFSKERLKQLNMTSAGFAFVKGDEVIYSHAFGYENLEEKTPATVEETKFRIGSISKLFVGTAAMMLVDQGKLDLHKDINEYLTEFEVPTAFNKPITLHHLLTHTGGFDEDLNGFSEESYKDVLDLSVYLKEEMPSMVREPGMAIQYSNYGISLAAYIVELVSGLPYETFVEEHIFNKVGMNNSLVKVDDVPNIAQEYSYKNESFVKLPLYGENVFPAADVMATVDDMTKFLIAHKNEARNSANVFFNTDEKVMYETQFAPHEKVEGYAYTFHEKLVGEHRFLEHAGDMAESHSYMAFSPQDDIGFYYVHVGTNAEMNILQDFYDTFYPISTETTKAINAENASEDFSKFEGSYLLNRHAREEFTKFQLLLLPTVDVAVKDDKLLVSLGNAPAEFTYVENNLFKNSKEEYIYFEEHENGEIKNIVYEGAFFDKAPWYHVSTDNIYILIILLSLFLIFSVVLLAKCVLSRFIRKGTKLTLIDILSLGIASLHVWFVVGFAYVLTSISNLWVLTYSVPVLLKISFILPVVAFLLSLLLLGTWAVYWKKGRLTTLSKVTTPILLFASFIFLFILQYYKLIGMPY
ncbi:serine hydrolase domain-containing protein [Cytobacillus sp. FJAT-54145]|uniref:Serine hydrolase domain-containing protein n=1 Tax=Cytobacillus spartinae TaxID=3299023 RepID=A0ABW6KAM6_9BACI